MISGDAEATTFAVGELRAMLPKRKAWSWLPWARVEDRQDRVTRELLFARLIGAGENYFLIHATRVIKPSLLERLPPPDPPDKLTDSLRNAVKDFYQVQGLWKKRLKVDVTGIARWQDFEESRQVRHILIHRLGRWEPGLDPKPTLAARIADLGENPKTYRGEFPMAGEACGVLADLVLEIVAGAEAELGRP